jgi:hypothetical protein
MYLDGQCYEFAFALRRKLGWPMVGLMDGEIIRHVLVREPEGALRDVRGRLAMTDVGKPFGMQEPYELRDVEEADVLRMRLVSEGSVDMAGRLAELVWPELSWNGEAKRMAAFADELEALSRKHGVWIRAPYPAALPILSGAFGEEAGYTITPTANAGGYMIDRRLT